MKPKHIILILFIVLFSTFSFGVGDIADGNDQIFSYSSSPFRNVDYTTDFQKETLTGLGIEGNQPTICDLNHDEKKEVIGVSGNRLYTINLNVSNVEATASYTWDEDILQVACVPDPYDAEKRDNIILAFGTESVTSFKYDGNSISEGDVYLTYGDTATSITQPHCTDFTDADLDANSFRCGVGMDDDQIYLVAPPFAMPYDYNGIVEINQSHQGSSNVIYDYLNNLVYFREGDSIYTIEVSDYISDGNTSTTTDSIYTGDVDTELSSYNDVFAGEYVCFGKDYNFRTDDNGKVFCYLDATQTVSAEYGDRTQLARPSYYDVNLDGVYEVCSAAYFSGVDTYISRCHDLNTGDPTHSNSFNSNKLKFIGNAKDIDEPYLMYWTGDNTMTGYNTVTDETFDITDTNNINYIFNDINLDGRQEMIGSGSALEFFYFTDVTATDNILIDEGATNDGLYGFYDPTCPDTQNNIRALECIDTFEDCTYFNTNDDQYVREKLCTDCGIAGADVKCGNWSYTNPKVVCNYSDEGIYSPTVSMYTDTNPSYIAQNFSMSITVSDVDCDETQYTTPDSNIGGEGVNETDDEEEEEEEETNALVVILDNIFVIISLLFSIIIMVTIATAGVTHPLILGLTFFGFMLFFSIIGWVPLNFFALISIVLVALAIITASYRRRE